MNIWIVDVQRGIKLVYYSSDNLPLNDNLISGLLSAINQLTMVEFKQPIESINMGGFKWIYILDLDLNLMFVASESIAISTETIKGRLSFIKDLFIRQFKQVITDWTGDVQQFEPFGGMIDNYYQQWSQAENVDALAQFYDVIGIFQQILNLVRNVVRNNTEGETQAGLYQAIEDLFQRFKANPENEKEPELQKIEFSRDTGFNIFNINPLNCDALLVKKQLQKLLLDIISILKEKIGADTILSLFRKEDLFNYIINNLILIKELKLDNFLLQLLLRE
ncbi:MAG: hypothetical protein EU533_05540 [Promethearchaeota archaeon]|nr:MAG: hypothetical protein EU533_05540 [Candidatus Lokiarchaeota archaeon]